MMVVFHEYFHSRRNRECLGCPHAWLSPAYEAPMRDCFRKLKEQGIDAYLSHDIPLEQADMFVFWERSEEGDPVYAYALKSGKPMFLIATESPSIVPDNYQEEKIKDFDLIFGWHPCYAGNPKVKRIRPIYFQIQKPLAGIPFGERELSVMVGSIALTRNEPGELYSRREDILNWFEQNAPRDFSLYGRSNPYNKNSSFSCYKGPVGHKLELLSKYKFNICFENNGITPEYITEKIFDCFQAGCVPVYLGAPDVEKWIPKSCYVDVRDFESFDRLYEYMNEMTEDRWQDYRQHGSFFLHSDFAASYGETAFADVLVPEILKIKKSSHIR